MSNKTVLVTGATGYKGTVLVPKLLAKGYQVIALDTQWFGNFLPEHENLTVIKGDVRHTSDIELGGVDSIIHLASIANDPCGDLDPKLTWEVSALATMQLADKAKRAGIKQFIYASSGSVYGVERRKSTRLNSSHTVISYAVFCLKKKTPPPPPPTPLPPPPSPIQETTT